MAKSPADTVTVVYNGKTISVNNDENLNGVLAEIALENSEKESYIFVTASGGGTTPFTYVVKIVRKNTAALTSLTVTDTDETDQYEILEPEFSPNIDRYRVLVDPLAKSVEFEFTTDEPNAELTMTLGDQEKKESGGAGILKGSFELDLAQKTFEAVFEVRVPADSSDPQSLPRYGRYIVSITRDGADDVAKVQTAIVGNIKTYTEDDHSATIKLYNKDGDLVPLDSTGKLEYTVDADGAFEIMPLEAGEYTMVIERPGYLTYTVKDIIVSETVVKAKYDFETIELVAGNLTDDGESKDVIDEADIEAAINALTDTTVIDLAKFDLNGDGVFDGEDMNIISFNVGVTAFEVSNLDTENVAHAMLRRY